MYAEQLKFIFTGLLIVLYHVDALTTDEETEPTCACGNSRYLDTRIVGGRETRPFLYPWTVTLALKSGNHYIVHCGATIISSTFLLTAAHCAENMDMLFGMMKMTLMANIGDHDISTTADAVNDMVSIKKKIQHPSFNLTSLENDIALLELDRGIQLNSELMPACLPLTNLSLEGENLIVTGWGNLKRGGLKSDTLQEISIPVLPQSTCEDLYKSKVAIKEYQFCAGHLDGSRDACQGDSGGPAVYKCDDGHYHLVGIISYGVGCASPKYPGVYSYVHYYIDWIRANTEQDPPCYRMCHTH